MLKNLSALNLRITLAAWKVVSRKWFAETEKGQTLSEYGVIIGVVVGVVVVAVVDVLEAVEIAVQQRESAGVAAG